MFVKINGKEVKLPDFFIIGAAKSGTTSLAKYLAEHPQIYIPSQKEFHFFLFANQKPSYYNNHILGPVLIYKLEDYLSFFKNTNDNIILGDCSVTYMYLYGYRTVIKNIKKYYPQNKLTNLKFISILRNPIDRAFSQYCTRLLNEENKPFIEACYIWEERKKRGWSIAYDYLGFSFYYEPLKAYMDEFGKKNVKIYLYEDLKEKPLELIRDVFIFLGVDLNFVPLNIGKKYNVSKIPKSTFHKIFYDLTIRYNPIKPIAKKIFPENTKEKIKEISIKIFFKKPQLTFEIREKLKEVFKEDILKLQELIGRDLSHWLK